MYTKALKPLKNAPLQRTQSKFKELDETAELTFVTEHEIGVAKGCDEEMIKTSPHTSTANAAKWHVSGHVASGRTAKDTPEIAEAF